MAFSFFGGIHPKENKWYAEGEQVQDFPEPDVLVIPMQQHIGAPCKPLVAKGDPVTVGQKIGQGEGLCVPVHASVSGTVKAVEMRPNTSGMTVLSVVIENDHLDTPCPEVQPRGSVAVAKLTGQELMDIIREAGIVGMGGATFPTYAKLSSGLGKVDTIIVNVSECEPYIVADDRVCQEYPAEVIKGLEIVMRILGLNKAHIAVEDNKQEAIAALKKHIDPHSEITVEALPSKYPQGAEKMQIKAITNREVKPGGLPSGVGCNVISTQTAYAIYRACYEGMPSIERVLTVAGSAMGDKSYNLQCRFGTPFSYIVEQCGGFVVEPKKIVLGGPMMGLIATNLEAPNIKGTAGILFFTDKEDRSVENPTCIHCGKCLTVCPMKLEPLYMYKYYQNRDFENMQKYHILDCFECGSCSYNCPGRLPLTHTFKTAKLLFAARAAEEKARAEAAAKEAETK